MKRIAWIAACSTLALACGGGGGGGGAPAPSFSYGTPQTVSGTTAAAANSAASGLQSVFTYQATPTADNAYAVMSVPEAIIGSLDVDVGMVLPPATAAQVAAVIKGHVGQAFAMPSEVESCTTVAGQVVTFNCSDVITDPESNETVSVTGSLTGTDTGVNWDITVRITSNDSSGSMDIGMHYFGNVAVTSTTLTAEEQVDLDMHVNASGQAVYAAASERVDIALNYVVNPFAVTDGTVEVRFWWRALPQGATNVPPNQGYLFTWTTTGNTTTITVAQSQ